jgi:tripartite-type tricarboxylate transporter receptor subunit TctC
MVAGFPPGSPPDATARPLSQKLADALGKLIVIANAPGAGGNIAADRIAKASTDGHTLGLLTQDQLAVNPSLYTSVVALVLGGLVVFPTLIAAVGFRVERAMWYAFSE